MSKVSKLQNWIEVENCFLHNGEQTRHGRKLPTEAYLFAWECRRMKNGIRRRARVHTLMFAARQMTKAIRAYMDRSDVVLIREQDRRKYVAFHGEPKLLRAAK